MAAIGRTLFGFNQSFRLGRLFKSNLTVYIYIYDYMYIYIYTYTHIRSLQDFSHVFGIREGQKIEVLSQS